ncbi:MAG: hypothetical protein M1822_007509 [Bathelium mastoideum]|nr:MAG: hypothetical protein M1822_007509 [Bathelium mastoideum]
MAPYDQFILFGDSITQQSGAQEKGFGFAPALQQAYIRRLDIVNRGFNGYNTSQALKVLPYIVPSPQEARVKFLTVFFGANDARLPNGCESPQHISPDEYRKNLLEIIQHPAVRAQNPKIILITPPPIDEYLTEITDRAKGFTESRRTAENTKQYAEIVRQLGRERQIPVLDIWTSLMLEVGWKGGDMLIGSKQLPKADQMERLLYDGKLKAPLFRAAS